eukprot:scaffold172512_cov18-Tisochrysis_lutea.AAC.2
MQALPGRAAIDCSDDEARSVSSGMHHSQQQDAAALPQPLPAEAVRAASKGEDCPQLHHADHAVAAAPPPVATASVQRHKGSSKVTQSRISGTPTAELSVPVNREGEQCAYPQMHCLQHCAFVCFGRHRIALTGWHAMPLFVQSERMPRMKASKECSGRLACDAWQMQADMRCMADAG